MAQCAYEVLNPVTSGAIRGEVGAAKASKDVVRYLAALWDRDPHDIEFLLATRSLQSLARVTSDDAWEQLLRETAGLLDPGLLFSAISWLQDGGQLELGLANMLDRVV